MRRLIIVLLILNSSISYSQENRLWTNKFSISSGVTFPNVPSNRVIYGHQFYDLNVGYSNQFEYSIVYSKNRWLNPFISTILSHKKFDARQFQGLIENTHPYDYKREFWSDIRVFYAGLRLGGHIALADQLNIGASIYTHILLKGIESRKEVWLTDVYAGNIYYPSHSFRSINYNRILLEYNFFISHFFTEKLGTSLEINSSLNSVNRVSDDLTNTTYIRVTQIGLSFFLVL